MAKRPDGRKHGYSTDPVWLRIAGGRGLARTVLGHLSEDEEREHQAKRAAFEIPEDELAQLCRIESPQDDDLRNAMLEDIRDVLFLADERRSRFAGAKDGRDNAIRMLRKVKKNARDLRQLVVSLLDDANLSGDERSDFETLFWPSKQIEDAHTTTLYRAIEPVNVVLPSRDELVRQLQAVEKAAKVGLRLTGVVEEEKKLKLDRAAKKGRGNIEFQGRAHALFIRQLSNIRLRVLNAILSRRPSSFISDDIRTSPAGTDWHDLSSREQDEIERTWLDELKTAKINSTFHSGFVVKCLKARGELRTPILSTEVPETQERTVHDELTPNWPPEFPLEKRDKTDDKIDRR